MHLSANQPQQQLATCGRLNLRCGHENQSQNSSFEKRSRQIAVFCGGLPSLTSVGRDLGEVRCIHSDFPRRSLELRWAMKQIKQIRLSSARTAAHISAVASSSSSHAVEQAAKKKRVPTWRSHELCAVACARRRDRRGNPQDRRAALAVTLLLSWNNDLRSWGARVCANTCLYEIPISLNAHSLSNSYALRRRYCP